MARKSLDSLMRDLRSDSRMGWLPRRDMWLTYVEVNERAGLLTHDLAIDASGFGRPDPVAAGLARPIPQDPVAAFPWGAVAAIVAVGAVVLLAGRRLGNRGHDGGGGGDPIGTGSGLGLERSA